MQRQLHAAYCRLTGLQIQCTMSHLCSWELWQSKGWTEGDLVLVIALIKSAGRVSDPYPCLRFHNLIQNVENFSEWLAEARARARVPKPTPKARVLRATGREPMPLAGHRTPAQILAAAKAEAEFKRLGESL